MLISVLNKMKKCGKNMTFNDCELIILRDAIDKGQEQIAKKKVKRRMKKCSSLLFIKHTSCGLNKFYMSLSL